MISLLETLKDSAESGLDSATSHVENIHRMIGGYVRQYVPGKKAAGGDPEADTSRDTVYDVIRGVNREIGAFGTDVFEIIEDARARRATDKDQSHDDR